MQIVWFLLYNLIFVPLLFVLSHLVAIFNKKMQKGLAGRKRSFRELERFQQRYDSTQKLVLFHCASLGEYEQVKPLLRKLTEQNKNIKKAVSFFSPSGFENMGENSDVDVKLYLPFDTVNRVNKFLSLLQPSSIVISKHDLWPNLIWTAESRRIPVLLVNGTMPGDSYMIKPVIRLFYRSCFRSLDFIAPASERDYNGFTKIVPNGVKMQVLGDTRYDQVLIRSQEILQKEILPKDLLHERFSIVAGSIWQSDEEHLFPAFVQLLQQHSNIFLILVPHEPTEDHTRQVKEFFSQKGFSSFYYTDGNFQDNVKQHRILIVNQIGILANLYGYGQVAYVGGSFAPGVHNVMEPAAFRMPVLFGPKILNSPEALKLMHRQAGFKIVDKQSALEILQKLFIDCEFRTAAGEKAYSLVDENRGAAENIIVSILDSLK